MFLNWSLAYKEIVFQLLIFLFRIYYYMQRALWGNQKLKNCAEIIKYDVEIWQKLKFYLHILVGIYNGALYFVNPLWNMFLIIPTQCLSYWLYFLFYYLVLDLKAQWD